MGYLSIIVLLLSFNLDYELSFLLPKLSALHSVRSFMMREENIDHISRKDDALSRKSSRSFWHS